ncbi:MAG: DUF1844 domain-containing protein [Pyrinomonadaceae bacterium]|jgi:hypothetical protein|nr:DUF1844 domain-containing protein [Pyrinomonadaceae bacterium]
MIGKETDEEVVLVVNDRRKFNFDGSVREGVELEKETPKVEEKKVANEIEQPQTLETQEVEQIDESIEDELLDAENPASFVNFLSTLASQAFASLGAMPHPVTGQRSLDLETAKYWIEVLAMIKQKTDGNLLNKEAELLNGILSDLKMNFVQINKMAEEKLKQQAAQKFSANDILGRK